MNKFESRLKQQINILNILLQIYFDSPNFISRQTEDVQETNVNNLRKMLDFLETKLEKRYYYVHANNRNERIYEFYYFKNNYLLETLWIIKGIIREFDHEQHELHELRQTLKRICRHTHFNDSIFKKDTFTSYKMAKAYAVYKKITNYAKVIPYATSEAICRKFKVINP
jgi:hypothetical protein